MNEELAAEELLARVAQEDVAALSELYDRYAPRVYGLVAHILPARDEADDVLRDVFVRLWEESRSLRQGGMSVAAWLVVTARATAVDHLHGRHLKAPSDTPQQPTSHAKKGSKPKSKGAALNPSAKALDGKPAAARTHPAHKAGTVASGHIPSTWLPQPEEISLIDDRLALLHKVVNQLPKPQRQALELAVFRGLSEAEIAAEMGEPLGKVRSSLRAAMTFIKHRHRAVCGTWAANI
jgi:RNA polymerase sigma-70 factor (ECF subfamily)